MLKRTTRCGLLVMAVGAFVCAAWPLSLTAQAPEVVRRVLVRQDLPIPNYEAIEVALDLPAGEREGRHTHAGVLIVHILEGTMTFDHEGKATATYNAGDTFTVEPGQIHEALTTATPL